MRYILFILIIASLFACNSKTKSKSGEIKQVEAKPFVVIVPVQIKKSAIPHRLKFRGEAYEAWQWEDRLGENILVLSTVAAYADNDPGERETAETAELHAFNFIKKDTTYKLLWKTSDIEKQCRFDLTSGFIEGSVSVTDLDSNGLAETTFLYRQACRSDVSPSALKLIMHEDTVKYALRGLMWLPPSKEEKFSITPENASLEGVQKKDDEFESYLLSLGRYENEKDFKNAPPVFLTHARNQWVKFVKENLD
jgi:hypothetical protein